MIIFFENKLLFWQAQCEDAPRYLGKSVKVYTWGLQFLTPGSLVWMQKHTLWAKDSHSNSCIHVHWFPPKRVSCHQSITWWCISDICSCIWHQWCGNWRDMKVWIHKGLGFQVDHQRVQVPSHNSRVPHCVLAQGLLACSTKREYLFNLLFSMTLHH